jgi:hypothetical protein
MPSFLPQSTVTNGCAISFLAASDRAAGISAAADRELHSRSLALSRKWRVFVIDIHAAVQIWQTHFPFVPLIGSLPSIIATRAVLHDWRPRRRPAPAGSSSAGDALPDPSARRPNRQVTGG